MKALARAEAGDREVVEIDPVFALAAKTLLGGCDWWVTTEGPMRRVNGFQLFQLGQMIGAFRARLMVRPKPDSQDFSQNLVIAQALAVQLMLFPNEFVKLTTSQASMRELIDLLKLPEQLGPGLIDDTDFKAIIRAIDRVTSVLGAEVPLLNLYHVEPKANFDTNALLGGVTGLPPEASVALPPVALSDLVEAGWALALELPTAVGFHLFRALEAVITLYFPLFKIGPLKDAQRNWGNYIKELETHGVEAKVCELLKHIKSEYRNPITHPETVLSAEEAISLYRLSLSAVSMMMTDILKRQAGTPL